MDPALFSYVKGLLPSFDDKSIMTIYQQVVDKSGGDFASKPVAEQAQIFKSVLGNPQVAAAAAGQPPAGPQGAPIAAPQQAAPNTLDTVTVTGHRLPPQGAVGGNFGTGPAGVVAGTQATDAQFGAPGATSARLNASADPAEMEAAARAKYHLQGGDSLLQRFTGGMQAATGALVGNPGGYQEYQKRLNDIDTAFTTGLVDAKQAAQLKALAEARAGATAAQTNAAGAQTQAQQAAQFGAEQVGRNNTAALSNQNTSIALELGDPESVGSKALHASAAPFLTSMGIPANVFNGMSGTQLAATIASIKPVTDLQQQQKTLALKDYENQTQRITAAAGANLANTGAQGKAIENRGVSAVSGIPMPAFGGVPGTPTAPVAPSGVAPQGAAQTAPGVGSSAAVIKQNTADAAVKARAAEDEKIASRIGASGMNMAFGPFSPSPATTTSQTNAANTTTALRNQQLAFEQNGGRKSIEQALTLLSTDPAMFGKGASTGKVGTLLAKMPNTQAQALQVTLANVLEQQYKANSAGQGGAGMSTNAGQLAGKEANDIMNMSPRIAYNRLVEILGQNSANARILSSMDQHMGQHGGQLAGWTPPDTSRILYNPRTHQTVLAADNAERDSMIKNDGYRDVSKGVFPGGAK
jgi:hypothetical protein